MPNPEKPTDPNGPPEGVGERGQLPERQSHSPEEARQRREERQALEAWSRECERLPDDELLAEVNLRRAAIDFCQRNLRGAERKAPDRVPKARAAIALEEKRLRITKETWAERKGFAKLSQRQLESMQKQLEEDIGDLKTSIHNTDPARSPKHLWNLQERLSRTEAELRIVDEHVLGVNRKSEAELTHLLQEVVGRREGPAASRQLRVVREALVERQGLTRMTTAELKARLAILQSVEEIIRQRSSPPPGQAEKR